MATHRYEAPPYVPPPKRDDLPPGAKWALGVAAVVALLVTAVVAMYSALVALVPLAVAFIPTLMLVWRARRQRLTDEGRDSNGRKAPIEANDYYQRELKRRGRIIDDRVA